MEHFPYLFAAYTIVWVVIFVYVLSIDRRARKAEKALEDLRRSASEPRPRD
jgi:CcmD family protein